jgi:hypothetical protein
MGEVEVYGCNVWTSMPGYETGINKRQLSLFRLSPQFINIRDNWWLRNVATATNACFIRTAGFANATNASDSYGVRPLSLIA